MERRCDLEPERGEVQTMSRQDLRGERITQKEGKFSEILTSLGGILPQSLDCL